MLKRLAIAPTKATAAITANARKTSEWFMIVLVHAAQNLRIIHRSWAEAYQFFHGFFYEDFLEP
jgi:hypothetical protein